MTRDTAGLRDIAYLDKFMGSFCSATSLHAEAVTQEGETFYSLEERPRCEFCELVRRMPGGEQRCRESYRRAAIEAAKWEEPYFFRCHAGLVIWAVPIIIRGEPLGSIICGQVLLWEPDEFFWQEQELFNSKYPVFEKLIVAAQKIKVVSAEHTQAAADLLFIVVNHIVERNVRVLEDVDQAKRVQQEIRQEMVRQKKLPEKESIHYDSYLHKERKLLGCVRLGDRTNAEKILSSLFADLFIITKGKTSEINQRAFELICLVSRAAVEGGVDAGRSMEALGQYNKELTKTGDIFYQAKRTIEYYLDDIFALANKKNLSLVKRARDYIMDNYREPLRIEDIASSLYISSSHLSRLFRQELDCTVLEYLTRVRVEKAVELLKDNQYSIQDVAGLVGFKNAGYFARVFKEYIGVTPLTYRNSLF